MEASLGGWTGGGDDDVTSIQERGGREEGRCEADGAKPTDPEIKIGGDAVMDCACRKYKHGTNKETSEIRKIRDGSLRPSWCRLQTLTSRYFSLVKVNLEACDLGAKSGEHGSRRSTKVAYLRKITRTSQI